MKLLAIIGTITGSKTTVLINKLVHEVKKQNKDVQVEILNLKDFDMRFCDGRSPNDYTGDTKKVIDMVCSADLFVIGTPIFQGSITGALKNLFDIVPTNAFRNKVMGFVATGGTFQHYLVIENQLKPIAGYFRAYVAPGYVFAHSSHFNDKNEIVDLDVLNRISALASEVIFMQRKLKNTEIKVHK